MRKNGLAEQYDAVKNSSDFVVTIVDASKDVKGSRYDPNTQTLYLDLDNAVISEDGTINSPLFVMRHELDHAYAHMTDPEGYRNRSDMKIEIYKTEEEKRVITNGDTSAATKLGESLRRIYGQTIRIPIADPTTTNVNEQEYIEKLNLLNNGIENSNGK